MKPNDLSVKLARSGGVRKRMYAEVTSFSFKAIPF